MSTRGCIAKGITRKWKGLYVHQDGNPTELGRKVWQSEIAGTTSSLLEAHPGGFSSFPDICYCHSYFAQRDGSAAKDSPYYRPNAPSGYIDSDFPDPLSVKWVYIRGNHLFIVLTAICLNNLPNASPYGEPRQLPSGAWEYGHCTYKHTRLASFNVPGPEPDWAMLEQLAEEAKEFQKEQAQ